MNTHEIMQDPYYTGLIYNIETLIHIHDTNSGAQYPDSLVKSALRQTMAHIKGTAKAKPPKNDKEAFKQKLCDALIENHQSLSGVTKKDYLITLLATEDSLKIRREMQTGSRGYLDFLKGFIKDSKTQDLP